MPTVAIVDGVRIMIFPFDHEPPHVHAFGADFRLKLAIVEASVLEVRGVIGPAMLRRLQGWMMARRAKLNELWIDAAAGRPIGKATE